MRYLDSFGLARRTRRVDEVRQVTASNSDGRCGLWLTGSLWRVEVHNLSLRGPKVSGKIGSGDHHVSAGVIEHELQAVCRIPWIHGDIRRPRLKDSERGDCHVQ
jgi:hypothetical protein